MALSILRPYVQFDEEGIATGLFAPDTRTLRILLIEDDPSYADFLKDCFGAAAKEQFTVNHTGTLGEGLAAAEADSWDLILLDLSLPDSPPEKTFQTLHERVPDVPVVILTGTESNELAEEALLSGAQDYLLKTETGHPMLMRAVRYALERHQYHRLLLDSETKHKTLVEQARDGILIVQDGHYRFANKAMVEMTGYSSDELARMPFVELVQPEDRELIADRYRRRLAGEEVPSYYETAILRKDGAKFVVEISATVITFEGKVATHAVVRDISRRRHLEDLVRDQTRRTELILQQTNDGFLRIGNDGRILESNDAYARLVGHTREELESMSLMDLEVMESPEEISRHRDLIRARGSHRFETRHRCKSGEIVDLEVSTNFVSLGQEEFFFSFFRDITHRRRMENRLHLLYRAMEQCPSVILIADTKGIIEYVNQKFTKVTGYTLPEIIGRNVNILKSEDMDPNVHRDLWETITEGREWTGVFRNRRKNRDHYWQSTCIIPVRDESGGISHYLSVSEDITELQSVREELAQNEKLAVLGKASAEIAHSIKNISSANLNSVHFVEEAFDTQDEDLMSQSLEVLRRSTMREYLLLMNVLSLAKDRPTCRESVYMPKVVDDVRSILNGRIKDAGIRVETTVGENAQWLMTDSNRLFQCLLNLCWNAVEAMEGGGELSLRVSRAEPDAAHVTDGLVTDPLTEPVLNIEVRDTGGGIDEDHLQGIFSPFFSTKGSGGTGLGLASVKEFVDKESGRLEVRSELGKGSVFRIQLPCDPRGESAI